MSNHQEEFKVIKKLRIAKERTEELGNIIEEVIEILKNLEEPKRILKVENKHESSLFCNIIEGIEEILENRIEEMIEDLKEIDTNKIKKPE